MMYRRPERCVYKLNCSLVQSQNFMSQFCGFRLPWIIRETLVSFSSPRYGALLLIPFTTYSYRPKSPNASVAVVDDLDWYTHLQDVCDLIRL